MAETAVASGRYVKRYPLQMTVTEVVKDSETFITRIYGLMVRESNLFQVVNYYHGDIVRDTFWLQRQCANIASDLVAGDEALIFFGVRDTGTSIGYSFKDVAQMNNDVWALIVRAVEKYGAKMVEVDFIKRR